tara:strand:+ start:741 stop:893 length:153 start_codon:yes stop_codon:yes gene_type:complete
MEWTEQGATAVGATTVCATTVCATTVFATAASMCTERASGEEAGVAERTG